MKSLPVAADRAMIVSGHRAATQAGSRILAEGGSVADASIAASAALTVVLGHATSIGGDCFALYHSERDGQTLGVNASGRAPLAASTERFVDGIPGTGAAAATVPALVKAWETLYRLGGKLPWRRLFQDAIELAVRGHPVSRMLSAGLHIYRDALLADRGCAELYFTSGTPVGPGTLLKQPALAKSLRAIAEGGADEFYRGRLAGDIARFFQAKKGLITTQDLERLSVEIVTPISTKYRGYEVAVMPPNSYGVLLLMQLNGLSAIDSETLRVDTVERLVAQMSAMKAAFEEGAGLIADPVESQSFGELLNERANASMRAAVRGSAATTTIPNAGGTSCVITADAQGNCVNIVQSTFHPFGCAVRDAETGILFNNRMLGFNHVPGSPNSVGPGKRPAHTLCPILVKEQGKLRYALASPGGLSQTLTGAQIITQLVDCRRNAADAVAQPRWCNTLAGDFLIEPTFPETVAEAVGRAHAVQRRSDPYFYGSAKVIEILPKGGLNGAADHRREASAAGI